MQVGAGLLAGADVLVQRIGGQHDHRGARQAPLALAGAEHGAWPTGRPAPASACPSAPRRSVRPSAASSASGRSRRSPGRRPPAPGSARRPSGWSDGPRPPARGSRDVDCGASVLARRRSASPSSRSSGSSRPRRSSPGRAPTAPRCAPPISSTSERLIARPRPVPPNRRRIEASACSKRRNRRAPVSSSKPMPVSVTRKRTSSPEAMTPSATSPASVNFTALESRLDSTWVMRTRVAGVAALGLRRDRPAEGQALALGRGAVQLGDAGHQAVDGELVAAERDLAGLDLREVEDVGQHPFQQAARRRRSGRPSRGPWVWSAAWPGSRRWR